jgi:DNA-binding LytR/AlgR family response regulator
MKDTVFIRSQNNFTKIRLSDIRWIRQDGHQVEIQTDRQLILLRIQFEKMIAHNDMPNIVRVHQAYAININFIE